MDKHLVLFSGGFDSVMLLERLIHIYPEKDIILLFFDYGQPNLEQEKAVFKRFTQITDVRHIEKKIDLQTNGDFFKGTAIAKNQYVEYRNLVFLSYAMNYAETFGINKVYMGFTYEPPESGSFKDCSLKFINNFNALIEPSGIELVAPFAFIHKTSLIDIAREYGIEKGDFFSCNNPTSEGKPCGVCGDCKLIEEMYSYNPLGN